MEQQEQGSGLTFFQALIRTATDAATVGVGQMAAQPQRPQARRKGRRKQECTPCAAMDLADKVREQVAKNRMFGGKSK